MIERTRPPNVANSESVASQGIAIVGMGCRFPGNVNSPEAYWQLLRAGVDAISEIPGDRWNKDDYYHSDREAPGKMYAGHGGFVEDIAGFDPMFFGITPREAEGLDPQHRLLLEVVWESLEHAGIAPSSLRGSDTGVFIGLSSDDYAATQWSRQDLAEIGTYTTLGAARSVAAGRVAYFLGSHGPVAQLDTSCSSSLVSVYEACQSLVAAECDLAIAGGANAVLSPAVMIALCKLSVLAPDGRCKTFDADADGYVRGEGCGIVVLKRLEDAIRDGDMIFANIRGAVINHDGASQSLTTPNGEAQQRLMRKALCKAGLDGRDVAYVEAHGTGTVVGDPIELTALNAVYGKNRPPIDSLYVGSAKTNIGHLEAAAGIAGLLKVVLMLQHREIPPNLHFNTPNPNVPWSDMALRIPTTLKPWPRLDIPAVAAVSSLGISGTNAHVILESADPSLFIGRRSNERRTGAPPLHVLPLSAKSNESLVALAQKYVEHIDATPDQPLADICFSAATARDHFEHRLAVVAASRDDLLGRLRAFVTGDDTSQVIAGSKRADRETTTDTVGFLFTGQGTHYAGMGRALYESQPVFRDAIERCRELLSATTKIDLIELLFGEPSTECLLDQTKYAQPVLFSLQHALVKLWESWGVRPRAVIGHSLGEFAAAQVAGVFDLESGLELVATRGSLMDQLPQTGSMAVVMTDEVRVRAATERWRTRVSIASLNGPDTTVISGEGDAIQEVLATLTAEGIDVEMLNTSHAGHSALIEPMIEPFRAAAEKFQYSQPGIDMISNVSGNLAGNEIACAAYWARHLREPVRFADGIKALVATGCRTFIEIGPNPNLLAMGMSCTQRLRPRPQWLPSLTKDQDGLQTMLYSLGAMFVHGADIDWQGFHEPFGRSRVVLPTYPFQRQSHLLSDHCQPDQNVSPPATDSPTSDLPRKACHFPAPSDVAAKLDHLRFGLEDESRELTSQLDEIASHYIIEAVEQMGFAWEVGEEFSESELHTRIPDQHRPKVARVFSRLVERAWLEHVDCLYRVIKAAPTGKAVDLLDSLQQKGSYPECELLRRAGAQLSAIWEGKAEPLSVLFPDGATDQAATFYSEAKFLAGYNKLAGELLREAVAALPDGETLRVLEIGAGTGGLTMHLLPHLPADRCEYVFSDLSPLFLHAARDRFNEFPFLQTALFDVTKSPQEQGVESNSFDLVVAANVLHATPRLHHTLKHVRQLLRPNGWLLLLEAANPPFWGDMIFTLIDGWWSFEDRELRPDYPLLRRDRWCRVLEDTGFNEVACVNDAKLKDDSYNTLYLAQSKSASLISRLRTTSEPRPKVRPQTSDIASSARVHSRQEKAPGNEATVGGLLIDVINNGDLSALILGHAASVMRLNPDLIDPAQPLSQLGLDSLMATELRAQLSHELGRDLSLNSLQMRRSVLEIADYVREDQSREAAVNGGAANLLLDREVDSPRRHLVLLQPKGDRTPLFFIPAGYGDLFAFQDIAHAIGLDQPVYGLQPASAKQFKTIRQMSIYRLVSAYIAEIKKVQPTGPYKLSGYSAGAIIAIELARELKRQGDEIILLVIFDPPSHVPFWLDWIYAVNYHISVATHLINVVRRFRSKLLRRLFHTVLDEGLRTHTTVTREHRVAPYPGRITHFRARLSQSWLVSMKPMGRFWRRIAQEGIEVHWIPGSHYGMLRGNGAAVVVDELYDCLRRAKPTDQK